MTLPNYFLADLPAEAALSATMITEACQTLKRNRTQYLQGRLTANLIHLLSETAANWLRPDYPFRKMALEQAPGITGFSTPVLAAGLDSFFNQLTSESLRALLLQELGHVQRLDSLSATGEEQKANRAALANGPELLVHIAAGNIPNPTLMSIVLGVLLRSAQFVKCASGTSLLPRLFAHSLYEAEPKLGACLEIAEWQGGKAGLEDALFNEADCVTVTGSDETLVKFQHRLSPRVRFLGYGHRVSFGYIASGLSGLNSKDIVSRAASDIVAWNQLGCLSPHVLYVEHGGNVSAENFAELLAGELALREESDPRGPSRGKRLRRLLPAGPFTKCGRRIHRRRAIGAARIPQRGRWFMKPILGFQLSCLHRFVYVKGVSNLTEALQNADSVHGKVSTVGLAAPEGKVAELATQLARWGVARVCPLGQMQNPPLTWRHDGRPALGDLVTWTDFER